MGRLPHAMIWRKKTQHQRKNRSIIIVEIRRTENCLEAEDRMEDEVKNSKSDEIIKKWIHLSYGLFGNMLKCSEYSFFVSTPQVISQLSFLMAVVPETTYGLRIEFGWNPCSKELTDQIEQKNILNNTEQFLREWRCNLREYSTPGKMMSARRALFYPKNAVSFQMNILECLRRYGIEWKVFEGAQEHRHWVSHKLEGDFDKHVVLNVWDKESIDSDTDKSGKKTSAEEEKEKVTKSLKKAPILLWISTANVAILPEIFDGIQMYPLGNVNYLRVIALPNEQFEVSKGNQPWNLVILPTAHTNLKFLMIYNFNNGLGDFETLRQTVETHAPQAPCIVRKWNTQQNTSPDNECKYKKYIYFPTWNESDLYPNRFIEGLQETMDMEEIFSEGGFGELAHPTALPVPGTEDPYAIGHIQHFSNLTFFNSPSTKANADHPFLQNPTSDDSEVVPHPFVAILWDNNENFPVFMGKITGKSKAENVEPEKQGFFKKLFGWI